MLPIKRSIAQIETLTGSVKEPNLPRREEIDPPGTNSRRIFKASSSLAVPRYHCKSSVGV